MPTMDNSQVLTTKLSQELNLTPQLLESLNLLQVPTVELQEKVDELLAKNPLLEISRDYGEDFQGDLISNVQGRSLSQNKDEREENWQEEMEGVGWKEDWGDSTDTETTQSSDCSDFSDSDNIAPDFDQNDNSYSDFSSSSSDDEEKHAFFLDSLTHENSLQDELMDQLRFLSLSSKEHEIAENIIGSINDAGYLETHLADIATICCCDMVDVERILKIIQSFEPAGVAARDLRECFLLQIAYLGKSNTLLEQVVRDHLVEIERNQIPQLAKKLNISIDDLNNVIRQIRRLSINPGHSLGSTAQLIIKPEVDIIEDENGNLHVIPAKDLYPQIKLSSEYEQMLSDPRLSLEEKKFITKQKESAQPLIYALEERKKTIFKIAEVIADIQFDFFKNGIEQLRPMTLLQVADRLNFHEATISRAIFEKYMRDPQGIHKFKFFFSQGYTSTSGEEVSARSIKQQIKDLIEDENPQKPLSDQDISDTLKDSGISISRRTVVKYRTELHIPPSHIRRQYNN